MNPFAHTLAILLVCSLPARAQDSESERLRAETQKLKADNAALARRLEASLAELKTLNDKLAKQDDEARLAAERLAKNLLVLEENHVEMARQRKLLEDKLRGTAAPAAPAHAVPVDSVFKIALLLEDAYQAFERKQFDRCNRACDEILKIDPNYSVAREIKEDALQAAEKPETFSVLLPKIQAWKKVTNSKEIRVPWAPGATSSKASPEGGKVVVSSPVPAPTAVVPYFPKPFLVFRKVVGKVTAVADGIGLVVLSVGYDDAVEEGDEFTLTRNGEFVAKVRIDRVDRKWAAGKVTLKTSNPSVGDDGLRTVPRGPEQSAVPKATTPLSRTSSDEVQSLRKELDEVRNQVRQLSDRLVPSFQGPGVSVEEASEELRAHLGILRGLLVRRVREGSAAEKAGLKANDVVPDLLEAQLLEALESGMPIHIVRQGQRIRLPGAKGR